MPCTRTPCVTEHAQCQSGCAQVSKTLYSLWVTTRTWREKNWIDKERKRNKPQSDFLLQPRLSGMFFHFRYFTPVPSRQPPSVFPMHSFIFPSTYDVGTFLPFYSELFFIQNISYTAAHNSWIRRWIILRFLKIWVSFDEKMLINSHPQG